MRMPRRFAAVIVAISSALFAARCTSSTTSVTAPDTGKCQVSASTSPSSYTATGGAGTLNVTAARDCTWSAAVDGAWISLGSKSGQGGAAVPYTVAANPTPLPRSGAITVSSDRITVKQEGAPCVFTLSSARDQIGEGGGSLSVTVTTLNGCAWTAASNAGWITVASGQSGTASGTVTLTIGSNSGADRTGTVTIATQTYTVVQSSVAAPPPDPAPTPPPPPDNPPPPPPSGPRVEFDGTIARLSGSCPAVTFVARFTVVMTDDGTAYKHGKCQDLREGRSVHIVGTLDAPLSVHATSIDLKGKND